MLLILSHVILSHFSSQIHTGRHIVMLFIVAVALLVYNRYVSS